jgi:gliding motility-associated-like protein
MFPPDIYIGNDTSICTGDSLMLYVNPYDSINVYHWFDGSSDSAKTVSAEGYYWIQAANNCGSDFDSVFVSLLPLPYVFIGNDTIIGIKDEVTLDAGNGFASYLWNTGSEYQSITVSDSGNYWVRVSDGTCFNSDTINIEIVSCDLFVPIVFTPNWDSYNDYFYAVVSDDITDFDLAVYNRWGERMWETTDINGKWDGKKNNTDCATGTYFWVVEYKCLLSNKTFTLRGSVTLLR